MAFQKFSSEDIVIYNLTSCRRKLISFDDNKYKKVTNQLLKTHFFDKEVGDFI